MINEQGCYKVSIFGDQYTLLSDEPSDRIVQAAQMVDALMKEMASSTKLDAKGLAILAALHLANKTLDAEQEQQECLVKAKSLMYRIDQELDSLGLLTRYERLDDSA